MVNALIVADDYTGAMDTGYSFAGGGRAVRVLLHGPETTEIDFPSGDLDVLAVDTDTRDTDPRIAKQTVGELFEVSSPLLYKKIDSTLRGNTVAEIEAAIDATGADLAVIAPAFPSTGRVTVNGLHLVDGVPLAEAGYNASVSTLSALFSSAKHQVTSLGIETVVAGSDAIRSELATHCGDDPRIVTCDAIHDRHLAAIASGAQSLDATILFVGSGGLASAISLPGTPSAQTHQFTEQPDGGALAVVGSVNDQTLEQLGAVPDELVHRIDPADAVREPERAGCNAAAVLDDLIARRGRAVVTAATEPADIERATDVAAALETTAHVGDRIARSLATAASETAEMTPLAGLFLTGGTVARAVLDELSVTAIDITGRSVEDGIPEGRLVDEHIPMTHVVTKAGGFGSKRSIINCLNFLDRTDDGR